MASKGELIRTDPKRSHASFIALFFLLIFAIPLVEQLAPAGYHFGDLLEPILIFAVLGIGLNLVTGYTGMLHLGVTGFMAIGAFSYAILTCDIYPFQFNCLVAGAAAMSLGAAAGVALGLPTMRLSGDYLAIVTLGFGEIVQSLLRNLDSITKGTQGINPLPPPVIFGYEFPIENYRPYYYLFATCLLITVLVSLALEHSRLGRSWKAIREDELASRCMGIYSSRVKLLAIVIGSAMCSLAGALWAGYLGSSGEPGNYDFQISVIALCIVIVGGMGSVAGVLLGSVLMIGFNSIVLVKASDFLMRQGLIDSSSVILTPNNWKYLVFGLALILMMRFKPDGLLPASGNNGSA